MPATVSSKDATIALVRSKPNGLDFYLLTTEDERRTFEHLYSSPNVGDFTPGFKKLFRASANKPVSAQYVADSLRMVTLSLHLGRKESIHAELWDIIDGLSKRDKCEYLLKGFEVYQYPGGQPLYKMDAGFRILPGQDPPQS